MFVNNNAISHSYMQTVLIFKVAIGYQYFNCNTIFWAKKTATLSGHDVSSSGIGGWNLNIHHHYNVQEG